MNGAMSGPPSFPSRTDPITPVSCLSCRSRKAKCLGNGINPCPPCIKRGVAATCQYPDSRRVPAKRVVARAGSSSFGPDGSEGTSENITFFGSMPQDLDQKTYRCEQCNKTFGRIYELRRHEKSHDKSNQLDCPRCGAKFSRSDALKRHLKSVAGTNRSCQPNRSGRKSGGGGRPKSGVSYDEAPEMDDGEGSGNGGSYGYEEEEADEEYGHNGIPTPDAYQQYQYGTGHGAPEMYPQDQTLPDPTAYGWNGSHQAPLTYSPQPHPQPNYQAFRYEAQPPQMDPSMAYHEPPYVVKQQPPARRASIKIEPAMENPTIISLPGHTVVMPSSHGSNGNDSSRPLPPLAITRRRSSGPMTLQPQTPITSLYPDVPPEFLPSFSVMESLIDLHAAYYHSNIHFSTHLPTLKQNMRRGTADITLLLVILWSGLLMATRSEDAEGGELGDVMDPEALERECLRRMKADAQGLLATQEPDVAHVVRLIQAMLVSRTILIGKGIAVDTDIHAFIYELQPLARFGQLPEDVVPRDPKNFAQWLETETRARTNITLLLSDVGLSDVTRQYPRFLPDYRALGPLAGPPPFLSPYAPEGQAAAMGYPWFEMMSPCSDVLYDSLPAAPATKEDWNSWNARDRARGGILDGESPVYTVRELTSWMDLPAGSPKRTELIRHIAGHVLKNGLAALFVQHFDFWARVVHCQELFAHKGYLMYDPPTGNSEDEVVARETRQRLVDGLQEFFANLPEDVKLLDLAADGKGLKEMAARWWGWERRHRLTQVLIFFHSFVLMLHSPREFLPHVESVDSAWVSSPSFVRADAEAIAISRLVRTLLAMPASAAENGDGAISDGLFNAAGIGSLDPAAVTPEEYRRREAQSLPPAWSIAVLRSAWVHCATIRRFCSLLDMSAPSFINASAIETVKELVSDVEGCLHGLQDCGGSWKQMHSAYDVISRMVARLLSADYAAGQNGHGWLLQPEELAILKQAGCV